MEQEQKKKWEERLTRQAKWEEDKLKITKQRRKRDGDKSERESGLESDLSLRKNYLK